MAITAYFTEETVQSKKQKMCSRPTRWRRPTVKPHLEGKRRQSPAHFRSLMLLLARVVLAIVPTSQFGPFGRCVGEHTL